MVINPIIQSMNRFFFVLFVLSSYTLFAQDSNLSGKVVNSANHTAISGASVLLMAKDSIILGYAYTDSYGKYKVSFKKPQNNQILLRVAALGYNRLIDTISIQDQYMQKDIGLIEKIEVLKEVLLQSNKSLFHKKDTTTVVVKYYRKHEAQSLESVLKDIPGIEVKPTGEILAHGKSIDKILIDGENLVGHNYKLLSRNLGAVMVDKVQIIDNYEDNPVLKSVLDSSEKVALNLKITSKLKNIWFGHVQLGTGVFLDDLFQGDLMLGLLKKRVKILSFNTYKTVGTKASEELRVFTNSFDDNSFSLYTPDNQVFYTIDNHSLQEFDGVESLFNKGLLNNTNIANKLSDKLSLRSTLKHTNDKQTQQSSLQTLFNALDSQVWQEQTDYNDKNRFLSYELELRYQPNTTHWINNIFTLESNPIDIKDRLSLNSGAIFQQLQTTGSNFTNHLFYTTKISSKLLLHNYFFIGNSTTTQNIDLQNEFVNDYIDFDSLQKIALNNKSSRQFWGVKNKIILPGKQFKQIITIRNIWKKEAFTSLTHIGETLYTSWFNAEELTEVNNSIDYRIKHFFNRKVKLMTGFELEQISLKSIGLRYLFFNPKLKLELKGNTLGSLVFLYNTSTGMPRFYDRITNYYLISYNGLFKGNPDIKPTRMHSAYLTWRYYNEKRRYSISATSSYMLGNNSKALQTNIFDELFSSTIYNTKHNKYLTYNLKIVNYFRKLKTVSKLMFDRTTNLTSYIINESPEINQILGVTRLNLSTSTKWNTRFSFDSECVLTFYDNEHINKSLSTQKYNLQLTYSTPKKLNMSLAINRYIIEGSPYNFLNTDLYYRPKESHISYNLGINNIFNEEYFTHNTIDTYKTSFLRIKLIPFNFLGSVKYRF